MRFPLATTELFAILPHRPPMVWIDSVLAIESRESGLIGECLVRLQPRALYLRSDGSIRPSANLEWIAQAYGFAKACQYTEKDSAEPRMQRAYLVGITNCETKLDGIENETELLVTVEEIRELPPAVIIRGAVTNREGTRLYCSAQLKLFADAAAVDPTPPITTPKST